MFQAQVSVIVGDAVEKVIDNMQANRGPAIDKILDVLQPVIEAYINNLIENAIEAAMNSIEPKLQGE